MKGEKGSREAAGVRARRQFTETVPQDLSGYLEEISRETGMNESAVVSRAVQADRERHKEQLMREGHEEMAASTHKLLQEFEHVDGESARAEYWGREAFPKIG